MRSLALIQKRVRAWLKQKRLRGEGRQVIGRERLEYASRAPTDHRAQAIRRTRVAEHGWRAPLNRRYTPLGAPLLVVEKKPEWAGARNVLAVQSDKSIPILPGETTIPIPAHPPDLPTQPKPNHLNSFRRDAQRHRDQVWIRIL